MPTIKIQKKYYLWTGKSNPVNLNFILNKKNIGLEIYGIFLGGGSDKFPLNIRVDHKVGDTKSRVVVRGVLTDKAQVEFKGNVNIKKGARRSDTHLEAKAILLSPDAKNRLEPYLEIDENDVKATHSTYAGPLDEHEIFYLQSRGLSRDKAKSLLTEGFIREIMRLFPAKEQKKITDFLKKI